MDSLVDSYMCPERGSNLQPWHIGTTHYQLSYLAPGFFVFNFIYLLLERGERREKEKESNINVWLPATHPSPGTWPATQARALTGN